MNDFVVMYCFVFGHPQNGYILNPIIIIKM